MGNSENKFVSKRTFLTGIGAAAAAPYVIPALFDKARGVWSRRESLPDVDQDGKLSLEQANKPTPSCNIVPPAFLQDKRLQKLADASYRFGAGEYVNGTATQIRFKGMDCFATAAHCVTDKKDEHFTGKFRPHNGYEYSVYDKAGNERSLLLVSLIYNIHDPIDQDVAILIPTPGKEGSSFYRAIDVTKAAELYRSKNVAPFLAGVGGYAGYPGDNETPFPAAVRYDYEKDSVHIKATTYATGYSGNPGDRGCSGSMLISLEGTQEDPLIPLGICSVGYDPNDRRPIECNLNLDDATNFYSRADLLFALLDVTYEALKKDPQHRVSLANRGISITDKNGIKLEYSGISKEDRQKLQVRIGQFETYLASARRPKPDLASRSGLLNVAKP